MVFVAPQMAHHEFLYGPKVLHYLIIHGCTQTEVTAVRCLAKFKIVENIWSDVTIVYNMVCRVAVCQSGRTSSTNMLKRWSTSAQRLQTIVHSLSARTVPIRKASKAIHALEEKFKSTHISTADPETPQRQSSACIMNEIVLAHLISCREASLQIIPSVHN